MKQFYLMLGPTSVCVWLIRYRSVKYLAISIPTYDEIFFVALSYSVFGETFYLGVRIRVSIRRKVFCPGASLNTFCIQAFNNKMKSHDTEIKIWYS